MSSKIKYEINPIQLRIIRKSKKLTASKVAKEVNISLQKYFNIEQGLQTDVYESTLKKLAELLECSTSLLCASEESKYLDKFFSILTEQKKMIEDFYSYCYDERYTPNNDNKEHSLEYFLLKSKNFFQLKFNKFSSDINSLENDKNIQKHIGGK
tara:strand:- start:622 stop:1083 length:462 start_codon:yes stop_codon:yes gene_type:complete